MPEKTEFEEKEYEQPLNHQLLLSSNNIWSPGQVFESVFGIDAALFANSMEIWQLFNLKSIPTGISLSQYKWGKAWSIMKMRGKRFPTFKVNILIQAKRPHFRYGVDYEYARKGITGSYWFFNITTHQQKILERLQRKLDSDALVVYACAAFHKFSDLDNFIAQGKIIENSTFVKPLKLTNHKRWVYDKPGTSGLANPDLEEFSEEEFQKQIDNLVNQNENANEFNNNIALENLLKLENIALSISKEEPDNILIRAFLRRRQILLDYLNLPTASLTKNFSEPLRSFCTFQIFTDTLNIDWFTFY